MGNPSALQRETKLPKRRLIPPGAVPIAAAARRAPAPVRTADPGPPPWATRARSATGNFFNRGVIRARRRNGRRPGKSERTSRPKRAERHQRQHCLSHRIPPLLRGSDDSRLAARQKKADRLPHAENQGTLACPLCHLPAWHWRSKLVSLIQLIRGSGGIDHEKSRSRFGAVRRGGAHRRVWHCQCIRNPGKRRPDRWPVAARPAAISRAGFEGPFTGNAARREIRRRRVRVELWELDLDPWAWHRSAGACLGPLARRHQPTLAERSLIRRQHQAADNRRRGLLAAG